MLLLSVAGLMAGMANAATVFNFDQDSLGTSTTFTDTVNGLSATFSSASDPGGFVIYSSMFETLTGNVLGDPGPAGQDNLALNIGFSGELDAVVLDFATSDFTTPSPLTLSAYQNSQLVGSTTSTGMFLDGFTFPEGEIAFDGAAFDAITISSAATDFAVDNITVNEAPEPGPFSMAAAGLIVLAAALFRNNLRASAMPKQLTPRNH
jgi:hypothetical protein